VEALFVGIQLPPGANHPIGIASHGSALFFGEGFGKAGHGVVLSWQEWSSPAWGFIFGNM